MDTEQKTAYELILATLRTTPDPMSVSQLQSKFNYFLLVLSGVNM